MAKKSFVSVLILIFIMSFWGCNNKKNNILENCILETEEGIRFQFDGFLWGTAGEDIIKYHNLEDKDIVIKENERMNNENVNYKSKWIYLREPISYPDLKGEVYVSYWFYNDELGAGYYRIIFTDKEEAKRAVDKLLTYMEKRNLEEYKNNEIRGIDNSSLTLSNISTSDQETQEDEIKYSVEIRVKMPADEKKGMLR